MEQNRNSYKDLLIDCLTHAAVALEGFEPADRQSLLNTIITLEGHIGWVLAQMLEDVRREERLSMV